MTCRPPGASNPQSVPSVCAQALRAPRFPHVANLGRANRCAQSYGRACPHTGPSVYQHWWCHLGRLHGGTSRIASSWRATCDWTQASRSRAHRTVALRIVGCAALDELRRSRSSAHTPRVAHHPRDRVPSTQRAALQREPPIRTPTWPLCFSQQRRDSAQPHLPAARLRAVTAGDARWAMQATLAHRLQMERAPEVEAAVSVLWRLACGRSIRRHHLATRAPSCAVTGWCACRDNAGHGAERAGEQC